MESGVTAQSVIKQYGTGYYRATFLFPRAIREAVWTLYRFVRLPDEVVDGGGADASKRLRYWEDTFEKAYAMHTPSGNQVVDSFVQVMYRFHIRPSYVRDYFAILRQDLTKKRYETYADLERYMHGSAAVIGYMMSDIIGFQPGALPHARALAEAFQLTNFLRDIKSDYDERGRIYLPQEDLIRFGVSEDHITTGIVDDAWKALMRFEVSRARALYDEGVKGIALLEKRGRKAVYAAALVYSRILDQIEAANYDVFQARVVVSPWRKTMLLFKAVWSRNQ